MNLHTCSLSIFVVNWGITVRINYEVHVVPVHE